MSTLTAVAVATLALLPAGSLAFKNIRQVQRGQYYRASLYAEDSSDPFVYLDKWARQQTLRGEVLNMIELCIQPFLPDHLLQLYGLSCISTRGCYNYASRATRGSRPRRYLQAFL